MSMDLETLKGIARQSLMADFFAARVEEEALWSTLKQLLTGLQPAKPSANIDKLKRLASAAGTVGDFVEKVKEVNLWLELKELVGRIQVK